MSSTEQVLVIRRTLFDELGSFQGVNLDIDHYLPTFLSLDNHSFLPRSQAESDPSYKQLIPYMIVTSGNKILHYRRGSGSGEFRLLSKGSIGIGGHINNQDGLGDSFDEKSYHRALMRELHEELSFASNCTEHPVALINDDTDSVGSVHLGIVHHCHLAEPSVIANEEAIAELQFLSFQELIAKYHELETWSQLLVKRWDDLKIIH